VKSLRKYWLVRVLYRVNQFWATLVPAQLISEDLETVQSILTDAQMALFKQLQPSEQAHSLAVLETLLEQGETHPDLLTAALLHDVGKILHPLSPWERTIIVITKLVFPGQLTRWGSVEPKRWKRPFVIAQQHPQWGASLARKAETSPLAVDLIREHQNNSLVDIADDMTIKLLLALQVADNQN
jgi:putative nucleotidyltransferase with HDIG domain